MAGIAGLVRRGSAAGGMWAALAIGSACASTSPSAPPGTGEGGLRYDPAMQETVVASRVAPNLCVTVSLPLEWRQDDGTEPVGFTAVDSAARIGMSLRSARDLSGSPDGDLARKDASLLLETYEGMLGRPAQSVSFTVPAPGAARWSATWIDGNLPDASGGMTVEALIVPLSREWVLELALTDVPSREAHEALLGRILSGLKVKAASACRA